MFRTAFPVAAVVLGATARAQYTDRVSLANDGSQSNGFSVYAAMSPDARYVVFLSDASNLVPGDTNVWDDVFVRDLQAATTQRVNLGPGGVQSNGPTAPGTGAGTLSITPDGRYVVFQSQATNLVPGDTNGWTDVFVRDRVAGTTERVSVDNGGVQGDGPSRVFRPAISADGRYVVFESYSTNLVAGDTNGQGDIFLRDRFANWTTRVSLGDSGNQAAGSSWFASITPDARQVVFSSYANNLVPGDTNGSNVTDIFVRDLYAGATQRVSVATDGTQADQPCQAAQASADGRYVVFESGATTLVPNDTNGVSDLFLRDRWTSTTERVSLDSNGGQGDAGGFFPYGSSWSSITPDGRYVAFTSNSTNLVPNDTNLMPDVFRRDRQTSTTIRLSVTTAGAQAGDQSYVPAISADGRYVAFTSIASNLVPGDTNGLADIFVRYTPPPPPPPPDNDGCASAQAIAGIGVFPFDTTTATTGAEGQGDSGCGAGIPRDVWFTWTAGFSGTAQLSLCNQTSMDSKIAVYSGSGCPSGTALACNNDACGYQSRLCFSTSAGSGYSIQIGGGPSGTATFTISQSSVVSGACTPIDDGSAENALSYFDDTGGSCAWLQRFGELSLPTTVTAISTAWSSPAGLPPQFPPEGSPVQVAIWDDPNDDGNPIDCVLLQLVGGTLTGAGTNTFQTFALNPPVTVSGYFFVGAGLSYGFDQYPIPLDEPGTCSGAGRAWVIGCQGSNCALDFTNLAANQLPPLDLSNYYFSGQLLLRPTCGGNTVFCVPGQAGVIACPCSNPGLPGRGCNNSSATGGAVLIMSGNASLSADTVVFTTAGEKPTAVSIVLQGTQSAASGAVFGMGVRCAAGSLKRLYTKAASGGSITAPQTGDPSVSARSAALGDPISPGSVRYYQVYYRDPTLLGGCPPASTFNITQGLQITWM